MLFIQRIKNWLGYQNLSNTDLNAEFNNLLTKVGADTISGANSTNGTAPTVAAMQVTSNPGTVGNENLSKTIQVDEQQLRFLIQEIVGGPQWYSPPPTNLTTVNSTVSSFFPIVQSRVVSGRSVLDQPMYLDPASSSNSLTLRATATPFVAYFNNSLQTFTSDITVTGLTTAASSGSPNQFKVLNDSNSILIPSSQAGKSLGQRGTSIVMDTANTIGANVQAASGNYQAFKVGSTEYFIAEIDYNIPVNYTAFTGNTVSGSNIVYNLNSVQGIQVGDYITDTGFSAIPANTVVVGISGNELTLNKNATGTNSTSLTFARFRLKNAFRGVGFTGSSNSDAWAAEQTMANGTVVTMLNLVWCFATFNSSTPGLAVTYRKPTVAYIQPTGPAVGDYWYDLSTTQWKTYNGTSFVPTVAVYIGIAIVDTSNVVAARSYDFSKSFSVTDTVELEYVSSTAVRANKTGEQVNVYGTAFQFLQTQPQFNTTTTLDSGEILSASTLYYCYVTDLGDIKTTTIAPNDRKFDLLGSYHPQKPWRAVGEFQTDGSSNIIPSSVNVSWYHQAVLPFGVVTRPLLPLSNQVTSGSSGIYSTSGSFPQLVTNLSVTITTTGRPVLVTCVPDGSTTNIAGFSVAASGVGTTEAAGRIAIRRGGVTVFLTQISINTQNTGTTDPIGTSTTPATIFCIDMVPPGTYTYVVAVDSTAVGASASLTSAQFMRLVAMEL